MRVLITGKKSFVGNHLADWLENYPGQFRVDKISVKNEDEWQQQDFSVYDVMVHVAGIAHVSTDPEMAAKYYAVNRDLTEKIAKKAKEEGVKQFVFLSSIIVYDNQEVKTLHITEETMPQPTNFYGKSKLEAEERLKRLETESFKVAMIRPPMIYGKGAKGNYPKLAKFAKYFPIFPNFDNRRSMIHVDNLSEFIRLVMVNQDSGIFYPQNAEHVKTAELIAEIRKVEGKPTHLTKLFNPIINLLVNRLTVLNKVFGSLTYDMSLSEYKEDYRVHNFRQSIEVTEK